MLIDLTKGRAPPRVNGRRVVRLRRLRHWDRLEVGQANLTFCDLMTLQVDQDPVLSKARCTVDFRPFTPGETIVRCPNCEDAHHLHCWLHIERCPRYGCSFPARDALRFALSRSMRFAALDGEDEVIKRKKKCPCRTVRDSIPFRPGERVGYCPKCATPFHTVCWMTSERCPVCSYEVAVLIKRTLTPECSSEVGPEERP